MFVNEQDPFETLGIPRTASIDDARAAHRRLMRQVHPDGHPPSEYTRWNEEAARVNSAWDAVQRILGTGEAEREATAPAPPALAITPIEVFADLSDGVARFRSELRLDSEPVHYSRVTVSTEDPDVELAIGDGASTGELVIGLQYGGGLPHSFSLGYSVEGSSVSQQVSLAAARKAAPPPRPDVRPPYNPVPTTIPAARDFRGIYAAVAAIAIGAIFLWAWIAGRDSTNELSAAAGQSTATSVALAYEAFATADAAIAESATAAAPNPAPPEAAPTAQSNAAASTPAPPEAPPTAQNNNQMPADPVDPTPNIASAPTVAPAVPGAILCTRRDYEGACWHTASSIPDLNNKDVLSFRLTDVSIALFSERDYQGLCDYFTSDIAYYRGSPAREYRNEGNISPANSLWVDEGPCPVAPVLCRGSGLNGICLRLDQDMPRLTALSVQVPAGLEVTVYSRPDYEGACAALSADVRDLQEIPFGSYADSARLGRHC